MRRGLFAFGQPNEVDRFRLVRCILLHRAGTVVAMSDNYPNSNQPEYGNQPVYGSQSYSQPGYDVNAGYGGAGEYQVEKPRSKWLGMTSLILAAAAFVIGMILAIWWAVIMAEYVLLAAEGIDLEDQNVSEDVVLTAGLVQFGFLLPSLLGIGAIIFGIIAIVKKSARGLGIFGMILAIVAPVVCFTTAIVASMVAAG